MIHLTCGHKTTDADEICVVSYGDYDCVPSEGFMRVVVTSSVCPKCARDWDIEGRLFHTEDEEFDWLVRDPAATTNP